MFFGGTSLAIQKGQAFQFSGWSILNYSKKGSGVGSMLFRTLKVVCAWQETMQIEIAKRLGVTPILVSRREQGDPKASFSRSVAEDLDHLVFSNGCSIIELAYFNGND